ncbi:Heavy metal-associated isoprenylated plant protein [Vigna angularis]|uniref:Heavy metal-associated isoprenylated plant protein n=1 Tax=Phaseolus angularis TaxID=3914 RepID=A0A8T0JX23_PHAAN|nr:Heavy metal-associated isoprenylated plant protein [Vigna angularis]
MKELEDLGCTILNQVDPKTMAQHDILQHRRFNRIIYNFPHANFYRPESEGSQIQLHKNVVRGFLQNAKLMLQSNGEIHINHKKKHPYSLWDIEFLASCEHLKLVGEVKFDQALYPGYKINRESGSSCDQSSVIEESSTFKFSF